MLLGTTSFVISQALYYYLSRDDVICVDAAWYLGVSFQLRNYIYFFITLYIMTLICPLVQRNPSNIQCILLIGGKKERKLEEQGSKGRHRHFILKFLSSTFFEASSRRNNLQFRCRSNVKFPHSTSDHVHHFRETYKRTWRADTLHTHQTGSRRNVVFKLVWLRCNLCDQTNWKLMHWVILTTTFFPSDWLRI